jgi:hypothetical protein
MVPSGITNFYDTVVLVAYVTAGVVKLLLGTVLIASALKIFSVARPAS